MAEKPKNNAPAETSEDLKTSEVLLTPKEAAKKPISAATLEEAAALFKQDPKDCLSFKDYGECVVLVTVAGQKLKLDKASGEIVNALTGESL